MKLKMISEKEQEIAIMLTSAGGIIALLQDHPDVKQGVSTEDEIRLKVQLTQFALKKLDIVVDEFWPEISDSIQTIEVYSNIYNCCSYIKFLLLRLSSRIRCILLRLDRAPPLWPVRFTITLAATRTV